jgi:hypothetical protein
MGNEDVYSITNVKTAASSFKTKDDRRRFTERYGTNMSGNGRLLPISKTNINAEKKQSGEYWIKLH